MRILLLVVFISTYITCPKNASAQYKSIFGDSSTSWSAIEDARCDYINTTFYEVWKKSVRNGKVYHEMTGFQTDMVILGPVIREDTISGKVFYSHFEDTVEYLLIDFGLEAGDTFMVEGRSNPDLKFVAEEVFYKDGLKHIRLNRHHKICGPIGEQLTFIEGTGTSAGLYNWTMNDEGDINSYLLCHFKDEKKVFSNNHFEGDCSKYFGSWFPKYDLAKARIFPNPTSGDGFVDIYPMSGRTINLQIYDLFGRLVFKTTSTSPYFPFSISLLADGIYPYILQDDLGNMVRGKIVKDQ